MRYDDPNTIENEDKKRKEWLKKHEGKPIIECKEVENYFWMILIVKIV